MARLGQTLPDKPEELDGATKAAILLLNLEKPVAASLLQRLNAARIEEVTRVLASLGEVPESLSAAVVQEFFQHRVAMQNVRQGGIEHARSLLRQSLDASVADQMLAQIETAVESTPFAFLNNAEVENLLNFVQDEHPQTLALILSYLPHNRASEILAGLPAAKQIEVVRRIACMERANSDVIREVEAALQVRLSSMLGPAADKVGGIEAVAEVLNLCDRSTEKAIMSGIESDDPDLVTSIRRLMFVFEDIMLVNDKGIQAMLKEVDNKELALALKTASEDLKLKIFDNMSERAAQLIREEMEYMGPVRVSEVEAAQQRIVDAVRRLEESGEVIVAGRGGESELIV